MFGRFGQVVEKKKSITLQDISSVRTQPVSPVRLSVSAGLRMSVSMSHRGFFFFFPPPGGAAAAVQHVGLRDLLHALRASGLQSHWSRGGAGVCLQQERRSKVNFFFFFFEI